MECLGDGKSSQLFRQMLKLRVVTAAEADQNALFKQFFMEKTSSICMAQAINNNESLSHLAKITDAMAELQGAIGEGLGSC